MSLCNGILTGCKGAPTLQEPMSVELMGMQNWHTIHWENNVADTFLVFSADKLLDSRLFTLII